MPVISQMAIISPCSAFQSVTTLPSFLSNRAKLIEVWRGAASLAATVAPTSVSTRRELLRPSVGMDSRDLPSCPCHHEQDGTAARGC